MLGQRICELRSERGWSQERLAKRLGTSVQCIENWESGIKNPSIDTLLLLAKIFRVTTDYLLGLEGIPRLSLEGLSDSTVAHLLMLIDDYKNM